MATNELPKCLQHLTRTQKEQLQGTLANDEASTNEEIVEFWINECSIEKEAAEVAITYRDRFLIEPNFDLLELHAAYNAPQVNRS